MFHLYTGNRLEDLSTILVRLLSMTSPRNPFEPVQVLVQNPGMAQWIKMQLARQQGISAGVECPLPSTFVWHCFQQTLDDIPLQSEFNKPFVTWRLMRLLDQRLDDPAFASLKWYLSDDQDVPVRRYQLCAAIADLFDQYLVYRPDWIRAWEAGEEFSIAELQRDMSTQGWQPVLWRDLVVDVAQQGGSLYHRANLLEALAEAVNSAIKPADLPSQIFIFGVSSLPPNTLEALKVLANSGWLDVHLFLHNPCRFYWGDVVDRHYLGRELKKQALKPGLLSERLHLDANPLLASWGRLGRDYICTLQELADQQIEAFEDYLPTGEPGTLLQKVQQDILDLENSGAAQDRDATVDVSDYKFPVSQDDHSIRFHIAHSALREVEILHDRLLDLFERSPELTPKDIIVMLPDVNLYAPFVQSVFGHADRERQIPYALVDQSSRLENPIIDAYQQLLMLPSSRASLIELIGLLEVPAVMTRFSLNAQDVDKLRRWVTESGVRWGLSVDTDQGVPPYSTWLNGLRRMLLGYTMGHDHIWGDLVSYGDVEGLEAELAGKLAEFLHHIAECRQILAEDWPAEQWIALLYELAERFFSLAEEDPFPATLSSALDELAQVWAQARYQDTVSIDIIRQALAPALEESRGGQRFLAGKVNFCTLLPMRSVPFKVVCLLGMNEGKYPRSVPPMGFDLMVGRYRSGDRSRRDDDKYLFLEAVMSARDTLYISYVGRQIRDNSELNPSILVSELLEYIGQAAALASDLSLAPDDSRKWLLQHVQIHHPLQPFNPDYYRQERSTLFSYNPHWLSLWQSVLPEAEDHNPLLPLEWSDVSIELDQLERFLLHPARYFAQHRLKARLTLAESGEEEDEPFAFDPLGRFQLREQILQAMLKNDLEGYLERLRLSGQLPYGAFGQMALEGLVYECTLLHQAIEEQAMDALEPVEIDLSLDGMRLLGWLDNVNSGRQLLFRVSGVNEKALLRGWLRHLVLAASGRPVETHLLGLKSGKLEHKRLNPIQTNKALAELSALLQIFVEGHRAPLPLPPKAGRQWVQWQQDDSDMDVSEILMKIQEAYLQDFYGNAEGSDPYWQRFLPILFDQQEAFCQGAESIWQPILVYLEDAD